MDFLLKIKHKIKKNKNKFKTIMLYLCLSSEKLLIETYFIKLFLIDIFLKKTIKNHLTYTCSPRNSTTGPFCWIQNLRIYHWRDKWFCALLRGCVTVTAPEFHDNMHSNWSLCNLLQ